MANISIRKYIYYLPHPLPAEAPIPYTPGLPNTNPLNLPPIPAEPTSTLVLTTPANKFVDIRILKPVQPGEPDLPNESGVQAKTRPKIGGKTNAGTEKEEDIGQGRSGDVRQVFEVVSKKRLEWAFAGQSTSTPIPSREKEGIKHSVWHHWIDSKFQVFSPEIPIDEGDMYPIPALLPDELDLTLEHGASHDPRTGKWISYEEMWRGVKVKAVGGRKEKVAIMMRMEDVDKQARGMVIRVGQYIQGMAMQGDMCVVERWEYIVKEDRDDADGMWTRTVKIGEQSLPCAALFEEQELNYGTRVSTSGLTWIVEELVNCGP